MDKRFIVTSIVKEELKARSGLGTISTEALDWVNDQVSGILDVCAATGRRTPGTRTRFTPRGIHPAKRTPDAADQRSHRLLGGRPARGRPRYSGAHE